MTYSSRDKVDVTESDIIKVLQSKTDTDKRITVENLAKEVYGKNISGNTDNKAKRYRRKYDRLKLIEKKLEILFDAGKGVIGIFNPEKNRKVDESFLFLEKPSDFQHYEVYYKQNFTKAEAFMIYSGLYNQESMPFDTIEQVVDKLVKNTSNNEFKEMAKNISLEITRKGIWENDFYEMISDLITNEYDNEFVYGIGMEVDNSDFQVDNRKISPQTERLVIVLA